MGYFLMSVPSMVVTGSISQGKITTRASREVLYQCPNITKIAHILVASAVPVVILPRGAARTGGSQIVQVGELTAIVDMETVDGDGMLVEASVGSTIQAVVQGTQLIIGLVVAA